MKRVILPLVAGMTLLSVGCSSDETIEIPEGKAITFENAFVNKLGRAENLALGTKMHTKLWGATDNGYVFNDQKLNVEENGNTNYNPPKYWAEETDYYFMAVAANVETPHWKFTVPAIYEASHPTGMYGSIHFNNAATDDATEPGAAGAEDVGVAYAKASTKGVTDLSTMSAVPLNFKHVLSRLRFTFNNGVGPGNYLKISNVTVSELPKSGNLDLSGKDFNETTGWAWVLDNDGSGALATTSMSFPFTNSNNQAFANGATITTETMYTLPFGS